MAMTFSFSSDGVHMGNTVTGIIVERRSNSAGALAMIALSNPPSNYELCLRICLLVKSASGISHNSHALSKLHSAQTVQLQWLMIVTLLNILNCAMSSKDKL